VTLLGGFAVAVDERPLTGVRWRLRKARDLVKMLALAPGHRLHREQLMDELWPERDPASAANNLNQVVHAARRVLGAPAIEAREELLVLHASVDAEDFARTGDAALRDGSSAAIRGALALYGGELLPEDRYEDWTLERRERLARLREELEEASEEAEPSDSAAHRLPEQVSSFVGREHELRELDALARDTRLLTLAGVGGCGKTRLAIELARSFQERVADGVAFVELAGVSDERLLATAAAAGLDITALPGRSAIQALADHLAPRALLLVLDNCEHVLPATAALCEELLGAAPGLRILATSREPLRVPGEVVFRVPSLAIPRPEDEAAPRDLLRYEAVALFAERASAAAPGFALDGENAGDVARICFRLDGLPLAIELAAARMAGLGTGALADRLDDRFRLLQGGSRTAPSRQQTLLATLDWSHELLAEDERVLFRRLAVFAGGFDLDAVETVCADAALDRSATADLLARLVEKSLVAVSGGRELRYRLLETVRMYAAERLRDAGEAAELARRHALWALDLAERWGESPRLDADAANLRAAHDALDPEERLRYCIALLPFWMRRIDLDQSRRRFAGALDAAPAPTELRARALIAASAIDYRAGTLAHSAKLVEESLEIARKLGATRVEWLGLQRLGECAVGWDDGELASKRFERSRRLAQAEGVAAAEALSIHSIGVARWLSGDLAGAAERLAESLDAFRAAGADEQITSPLSLAEGRPGDGVTPLRLRIVFEESLQPFYEISCDAAIGYVLANQATISRQQGEPGDAARLLDEAAGHFARMGDERGEAAILIRRGHLELSRQSTDEARRAFERALEMRRALADRRGVGMALSGLALTGLLSGELELASRQLDEALELFRRAGDRWGLVSALWRAADVAVARGRLDEAKAALEEARGVVIETERANWIAVTVAMQEELARPVPAPVQSSAAEVQTRRKAPSRRNGGPKTS
jgi:predicted ATPase